MSQYVYSPDKNEDAIIETLKSEGASVVRLGRVGKGVPDLLVGYRGVNLLMEVKHPELGKIELSQRRFFETWGGQAVIVYTPEEAVTALRTLTDSERR